MNFKGWESADRIEIKKESKTSVGAITDRSKISQIATFAEARHAGWGTPLAGTPVANVTLDFYSRGQFLGHLGIGETFLESQGCNGFVSRTLTKKDRGQIAQLIGLADDMISK